MGIFILEGPDGTGKTTLAQELVKRGYRLHHHHHRDFAPDCSAFDYYTRLLLEARAENVVFDRFYPSEVVYGPVMRGSSKIDIEQLRLLNRLFFSAGGAIIFCDTAFDIIEEGWNKRKGQEYVDDDGKLHQVWTLYKRLRELEFGRIGQQSCLFDMTSCSAERTASFLIAKTWPRCYPDVIGSPVNKYLLVGERSDDPKDLAFYSNAQSAHFLSEALWEAGYTEPDLAFTNAELHTGHTRWLKDIYSYRQQKVIALGRVAQEVCYKQGVPFLAAEHPQYIKRFKLDQRGKYVKLLRSFR